jgi:hypothetical protein
MISDFAEDTTRCEPSQDGQFASTMSAAPMQALTTASRGCCCSARPVVVAVLPLAPDRDHPVDLLLCAHHYRASREPLAAAGASVFDKNGSQVVAWTAALACAP